MSECVVGVAALLSSGVALLSSGVALGTLLARREEGEGAPGAPRGRGGKAPAGGEEAGAAKSLGFSMKEAMEMSDAAAEAAKKRSPTEVLAELQRGNTRFWTGTATRPEKNAFERRVLIAKQFPSCAVLGCADSRVPVEIVFDQGLGDMFVVRVAGNCLDTTTTASLQFAVNHLKVKVLMVMGHEACGAVKAAQLPTSAIEGEPKALSTLLKGLKGGLDEACLARVRDTNSRDREAVTTNVKQQVEKLMADATIMAKVKSKELIIVGTYYELSSGIVDFFHEVTDVSKPA